MNFSDLHLIPPILRAAGEVGYETPSPIQQKAIPPVLAGRDLLGCAQTGTGKTAAFAMPILQRLYETPAPRAGHGGAQHDGTQYGGVRQNDAHSGGALRGGMPPKSALGGGAHAGAVRPIRALILTPTRELALQIDESFADYGRHLPLTHCVIFGGVNQNPQVEQLQKGVDILTATPGRLNDLIGQGYIDLGRIEIFVLDEADRMLDMGFVHDVKRVITHLPQKRQTLLFSATMPREIEELADRLLHSPEKVMVAPPATTVESIGQSVYFVDKGNKRHLLAKLLQDPDVTSALVFTRTKHGADRVVRELARAGIGAMAIHGNKSQNARQNALGSFKDGRIRVLVATDIAARGIDITGLSHVFNYDLPNIPETYVHRIGRTGRAGRAGIAISFCDFEEQEYLADIEKLTHIHIPPVEHEWPMQIFEKPEKQTQPPKAHMRQNMPQKPVAQQNADVSLRKGEQAMEQKNKAPRQRINGTAAEAPLATGAPLAVGAPLAAGTPSSAGNPAEALTAAQAAAGTAQTEPGNKRRRRGGRRHKSGAQTAAAQATPQTAPQQQRGQVHAAQNAGQTQAVKNGPNAKQNRSAKNGPNAGQSQTAKNGPNAGQKQAVKNGQNAGQKQAAKNRQNPGPSQAAKNGSKNGANAEQNRAAKDAPRAKQNRAAKNEPNIGQTRAARETSHTQTAHTSFSAERDDSLQVISRRTPAQKYASFEDYMKAHE